MKNFSTEDEMSGDGFNLEGREEGHALFLEDRKELIDCTLLYMKARFDPLLEHPVLEWIEDSLEHRLWPAPDDLRFTTWGDDALRALARHFAGLTSMRDFDLKEALHQWSRLKKQLHSAPFFGLSFKGFWEHTSRHYDNPLDFSEVLKLARIALLILADSSICEQKFAAYNRMHTAERANLNVDTIRSAFAIKSYGPQSIRDFNPEAFYDLWMGLIAPDGDGPAITCPRRRNIAALIRKMMQEAQTRHETGSLPTLPA